MSYCKLHNFTLIPLTLILALSSNLISQEKIRSNDPITIFKLPHFGEDGLIDWDIQGNQGTYSPERIVVKKLVFRLFDNQENPQPETIIESPYAVILPNQQNATSEEPLVVNNNQFQIKGQKWEWDGRANKIFIHKTVEVFFHKGMIDILK